MGQTRKNAAQGRCEAKAKEIFDAARAHKKDHPEISNTTAIKEMLARWEKTSSQEKTMIPKVVVAVKTLRRHGTLPSCLSSGTSQMSTGGCC